MIMVKKAVMIVGLMSLCLASFAEGLELDLDSVASRNHPRLFFSAAADEIVDGPENNADAIIEAWYPGAHGGTAIAEVLLDDYTLTGIIGT